METRQVTKTNAFRQRYFLGKQVSCKALRIPLGIIVSASYQPQFAVQ
jgi:hypothetical protein